MPTVITWNGKEVPKEMRGLPSGRYVVEALHASLTSAEERAIVHALESLDAGEGVPLAQARRQVAAAIKRGKTRR